MAGSAATRSRGPSSSRATARSGRSRASPRPPGRRARAWRRGARCRCSARTGSASRRPRSSREEVVDDAGRGSVAQVEGEVRQAEPVRERPGAADGLRPSSSCARRRSPVGPELSVTATRRARPALQQRRDRAVHAAAHRDEGAIALFGQQGAALCRDQVRKSAMKRIGRKVGGMELPRRKPAQLVGDVVRADDGRLEQRSTIGERRSGTSRRKHGPAPLGIEGDTSDPPVLASKRDPDQITTGRPAGGPNNGTVGDRPTMPRKIQMLREGHTPIMDGRPTAYRLPPTAYEPYQQTDRSSRSRGTRSSPGQRLDDRRSPATASASPGRCR